MSRLFHPRTISVIRAGLAALVVLVLVYTYFFTDIGPQTPDQARRDLAIFGPWGPYVAMLLHAVGVVLLVPSFLLMLLTAAVYGLQSFWISLVGQVLGGIICFYLARFAGHDFFQSLIGQRLHAIQTVVLRHARRYLTYLRLLALIPTPLVNYGPGLMPVRFRDFLFSLVVGSLPLLVVFAFFGDALAGIHGPADLQRPRFLLPAVMIAIVILGPIILAAVVEARRRRARRIAAEQPAAPDSGL